MGLTTWGAVGRQRCGEMASDNSAGKLKLKEERSCDWLEAGHLPLWACEVTLDEGSRAAGPRVSAIEKETEGSSV